MVAAWAIAGWLLAASFSVADHESWYSDSVVRDFLLRDQAEIEVTNLRGRVTVQGWPLDKVRVRAVRRVKAGSQEEAQRALRWLDVRFQSRGRQTVVSADFGKGMNLASKLQERVNRKTAMDLEVYAPAHFPISVWASESGVTLKGWGGPADVRAVQGALLVEGARGGPVSVLCARCQMKIRKVRGGLRVIGGEGNVELYDVRSPQVYVESDRGSIRLGNIEGEQLYVTQSGDVTGVGLRGRIDFHTRTGQTQLDGVNGWVSGRSDSGKIAVQVMSWLAEDRAFIESKSGHVSLALPQDFNGELELVGPKGAVFPEIRGVQLKISGESSREVHRGIIGLGGEPVRIATGSGTVRAKKF